MSLDTLFIIACTLLYIALAWRLYISLNEILPGNKGVNIITGIFWPGFIIVMIVLIVFVFIVGCILACGFAIILLYDIIKTLLTGKPIKVKEAGVVVDEYEYEPEEEGE